MARKSDGSVLIETLFDTSGFDKGAKQINNKMGSLMGTVSKLGVTIAAAFSVRTLINFGKEAIDLGSDLQEVQNVVDVTFTSMNEEVNEFAKNAAKSAGLSETMAKRYAGTFGAMAKAFGFAEEQSFEMSTALTQLAGDVASFYNLTQDEAYTKLKSVFTGETESLKDLGVVITQTALDSFAMAEGYGKTTKEMSEQEKVALRYAFVLDQLSAASGDFVRTSDSWANQTRVLSLNFQSLKANVGQALINIFTPFLKVVNQIVEKMAELSRHVVTFSEMLVGKQTSGGGGSPGEAQAEIAKGYEDIADATEEATKAQNKYLTGLDEIQTFSDSKGEEVNLGIVCGGKYDATGQIGQELGFEDSVNIMDRIIQKIEELRQKFPVINSVFNIIQNGIGIAKTALDDFLKLLTAPFMENQQGFLQFAITTGTTLSNLFQNLLNHFETFSTYFLGVYDRKISPVINGIAKDISELVSDFLSWFNEDMAPVLDRWGEKFDELWVNHISKLWGKITGFFSGVAEDIGYLWNEWLQPLFEWFVNDLLPFLTPAIEQLGNVFMDIFGKIADVIGYVMDILGGLISFITGYFTGGWEKAWEGLKEIAAGIINIISLLIEGLVNTFVDSINGVINGLNDLVSIGGVAEFFGFKGIPTIPKFDIPELATGAVIPPNAPFMAMLGDQKHGTNIEAPLDTIKQAVREVVGNGGGGGQYRFSAQINRRVLFDEMIEEAKLRKDTTGFNPFDLA